MFCSRRPISQGYSRLNPTLIPCYPVLWSHVDIVLPVYGPLVHLLSHISHITTSGRQCGAPCSFCQESHLNITLLCLFRFQFRYQIGVKTTTIIQLVHCSVCTGSPITTVLQLVTSFRGMHVHNQLYLLFSKALRMWWGHFAGGSSSG